MKHLLIALCMMVAVATQAQEKKPEAKPQYNKIAVFAYADAEVIYRAFVEWKKLCPYDKSMNSEQRIKLYEDLDTFLSTFNQRMKLDSVLVKKDTISQPPIKKPNKK